LRLGRPHLRLRRAHLGAVAVEFQPRLVHLRLGDGAVAEKRLDALQVDLSRPRRDCRVLEGRLGAGYRALRLPHRVRYLHPLLRPGAGLQQRDPGLRPLHGGLRLLHA